MVNSRKFGPYFKGSWDHPEYHGVGLALTGYPTDPVAFIELLQAMSCSPTATRRILDSLEAGETKYTTVLAQLDFIQLGDKLAGWGVGLGIVAPSLTIANMAIDSVATSILAGRTPCFAGLTPEEVAQVHAHVSQARASMVRIPVGLGAYE